MMIPRKWEERKRLASTLTVLPHWSRTITWGQSPGWFQLRGSFSEAGTSQETGAYPQIKASWPVRKNCVTELIPDCLRLRDWPVCFQLRAPGERKCVDTKHWGPTSLMPGWALLLRKHCEPLRFSTMHGHTNKSSVHCQSWAQKVKFATNCTSKFAANPLNSRYYKVLFFFCYYF